MRFNFSIIALAGLLIAGCMRTADNSVPAIDPITEAMRGACTDYTESQIAEIINWVEYGWNDGQSYDSMIRTILQTCVQEPCGYSPCEGWCQSCNFAVLNATYFSLGRITPELREACTPLADVQISTIFDWVIQKYHDGYDEIVHSVVPTCAGVCADDLCSERCQDCYGAVIQVVYPDV